MRIERSRTNYNSNITTTNNKRWWLQTKGPWSYMQIEIKKFQMNIHLVIFVISTLDFSFLLLVFLNKI